MLKPITKAVNELMPSICMLAFILPNNKANVIKVLHKPPIKK